MKYLAILVLAFNFSFLQAQDTLLVNNVITTGKIVQISTEKIVLQNYERAPRWYEKPANMNVVSNEYLLTNISKIKFNDTKEYIIDTKNVEFEKTIQDLDQAITGRNLENKAQADARKIYGNQKFGGATTTSVISAIPIAGIVLGLIPAAITANKLPPRALETYPDVNLIMQKSFNQAYVKEVKTIKRKKVWRSYWQTAGINALVCLGLGQLYLNNYASSYRR